MMSMFDALKIFNYAITKFKQSVNNPTPTNMIGGYSDNSSPTQSDKPSPSGSLSVSTLLRYARRAFPSADVKLWRVMDSNSMEPFIDDNCVVAMRDVKEDHEFRKGQIMMYDGDYSIHKNFHGKMILHEIVDTRRDAVKFSGRNNYVSDGWVFKEAVTSNLEAIFYGRQLEIND